MFVASMIICSQAPSGATSKSVDIAPDGACLRRAIEGYKHFAPPALSSKTADSIEL